MPLTPPFPPVLARFGTVKHPPVHRTPAHENHQTLNWWCAGASTMRATGLVLQVHTFYLQTGGAGNSAYRKYRKYRKSYLQPAHSPASQMVDPALRQRQWGRTREIHRQIGNQEQVLPVPGSQNRHTELTQESWRGLLRLGCAPLVAVVKPAKLEISQ